MNKQANKQTDTQNEWYCKKNRRCKSSRVASLLLWVVPNTKNIA